MLFFSVHYDREVTKKALHLGIGDAMTEVAETWHRKMLPDHFKMTATARYGYRRRTTKYQKRKRRKWHRSNPLVWSGDLREGVRLHRIRVFKRTGNVHIIMPKARAANLIPPSWDYHIGDEIDRYTTSEESILAEVLAKRLPRAVMLRSRKRTTRIG